jgi:hypothetical protein
MADRSPEPAAREDGRRPAPHEAEAAGTLRSETFATPGPLELELRLPAGRLEIQAGDRADTVVELEAIRDNEASIAAVTEARVELRERATGGQQVLVHVREAERAFAVGGIRIGLVRSPEVLVRVACPHGTTIDAETESADVKAHGRYAAVKLSGASSDVEIEHVDGPAELSTASGDVELGLVGDSARVASASGDVKIELLGGDGEISLASGDVLVTRAIGALAVNTASGDVVVREAGSSVRIKTASGDQRLDSVASGDVNLQSASGDIQVKVRSGTRVWLDARSRSGDTTSDLDVGDAPPAEEGPALELRATSMSGDIHIGRAA